jgi:hypothetical protein
MKEMAHHSVGSNLPSAVSSLKETLKPSLKPNSLDVSPIRKIFKVLAATAGAIFHMFLSLKSSFL